MLFNFSLNNNIISIHSLMFKYIILTPKVKLDAINTAFFKYYFIY